MRSSSRRLGSDWSATRVGQVQRIIDADDVHSAPRVSACQADHRAVGNRLSALDLHDLDVVRVPT
jgi:hypothetical protein